MKFESVWRLVLPMLVYAATLAQILPANAADAMNGGVAFTAVRRFVCFSEYWSNRPDTDLLSVAVRTDGRFAYAWIEGLHWLYSVPHVAVSLQLASEEGKAAIVSSNEYNADALKGITDFEDEKNRVFGAPHENRPLKLSECAPEFDSDTPMKQRMLANIERTIVGQLMEFNANAGAHYPRRLNIVIANFNVESKTTYILIPDTSEVMYVTLHDYEPFDDTVEKGTYLSQPVYRRSEIRLLRGKIMKIGIEREVQLGK